LTRLTGLTGFLKFIVNPVNPVEKTAQCKLNCFFPLATDLQSVADIEAICNCLANYKFA